MSLVKIKYLSKSYSDRLLFDDNRISINEGEKVLLRDFSYAYLKNDQIWIIGPNGSLRVYPCEKINP